VCVGVVAEAGALQHLAQELQRIWVEALQKEQEKKQQG
jgi:hypothetical protein